MIRWSILDATSSAVNAPYITLFLSFEFSRRLSWYCISQYDNWCSIKYTFQIPLIFIPNVCRLTHRLYANVLPTGAVGTARTQKFVFRNAKHLLLMSHFIAIMTWGTLPSGRQAFLIAISHFHSDNEIQYNTITPCINQRGEPHSFISQDSERPNSLIRICSFCSFSLQPQPHRYSVSEPWTPCRLVSPSVLRAIERQELRSPRVIQSAGCVARVSVPSQAQGPPPSGGVTWFAPVIYARTPNTLHLQAESPLQDFLTQSTQTYGHSCTVLIIQVCSNYSWSITFWSLIIWIHLLGSIYKNNLVTFGSTKMTRNR